MPRRMSLKDALAAGAMPIDEAPVAPRRKISREEAEKLGAVPVDEEVGPSISPEEFSKHLDLGEARMKESALKWGLGALSSGAQGAIPAAAGVLAAGRRLIAPASLPPEQSRESIADAYRRARDEAAKTVKPAEEYAGLSGAIAGQLPSMAMSAPTAAGRVGVNALVGLAQSGFKSGGDPAEMAKGAALSAAFSGGGEALGAGLGKVADWAGSKAGLARQATIAAEQSGLEKAQRSARSALGGETSSGARTLEQAQTSLADPNVDPAIKEQAMAFISSPEGIALRNQVLKSSVERGQGQLGRIESAKQAFEEASQSIPERAAAAAAAKSEPGAVISNLGGRLYRSVGQRAALAMSGAAVGSVVGGEKGGLLGTGLGLIAPGSLQMMRNISKYGPAQELMYSGISSAARGMQAIPVKAGEGLARTPKPTGNRKADDEEAVDAWNSQ